MRVCVLEIDREGEKRMVSRGFCLGGVGVGRHRYSICVWVRVRIRCGVLPLPLCTCTVLFVCAHFHALSEGVTTVIYAHIIYGIYLCTRNYVCCGRRDS